MNMDKKLFDSNEIVHTRLDCVSELMFQGAIVGIRLECANRVYITIRRTEVERERLDAIEKFGSMITNIQYQAFVNMVVDLLSYKYACKKESIPGYGVYVSVGEEYEDVINDITVVLEGNMEELVNTIK